jgi:hypothetical protein
MKVKFKMNWAYIKRHWKAIAGAIVGSAGFAYAMSREYDSGVNDGSAAMSRVAMKSVEKLAENPKSFTNDDDMRAFANE